MDLQQSQCAILLQPMNPHEYQSSSRGATAGLPPPKKKKIRKFQRLRNGFSRIYIVPTTRPECFKVRLNCECVCCFGNGFQFGTHTHFSLAALPRRVPPSTPSRLRGRQGRPTAANSSWSQAWRGKGGICIHTNAQLVDTSGLALPSLKVVFLFICLTMLM